MDKGVDGHTLFYKRSLERVRWKPNMNKGTVQFYVQNTKKQKNKNQHKNYFSGRYGSSTVRYRIFNTKIIFPEDTVPYCARTVPVKVPYLLISMVRKIENLLPYFFFLNIKKILHFEPIVFSFRRKS